MNRLYSFLLVFVAVVWILSCGKSPTAPQIPQDEISFSEDKIPLEGSEFLYRQSIAVNFHADSENLFAYRLTTLVGQLPEGMAADDEGWLYHRVTGSDNNIPLSEPGTHRSIWTSKRILSLDFTSQDGKIGNLVTKAEVRIKSPGGSITQREAAFRSNRLISSRISVPFDNGAQVGTGIAFQLSEVIGDIYVEGLYASHFMFRLNTMDSSLNIISQGVWHSSLDYADLRKISLNSYTSPAILPNAQGQFTQFESYVVSRQGIVEAEHRTVYFRSQTGYRPKAIIYQNSVVGLGQYHYSTVRPYEEDMIPQIGTRYNLNPWGYGTDSDWEVINSNDLQLHLRWGYNGQYGTTAGQGPVLQVTNDPFDREINTCLDEGGYDYGSKVVAFDLRLNGAPFPVLSQFFMPTVYTHSDGTQWLRVQNMSDNDRHCILSNLPNGILRFEACAVDLQGQRSDSAIREINLVPFKPLSQRSGILIVDDSREHNSVSPETYVDGFYDAIVPTSWGEVDVVETYAQGYPGLGELVSPVLMQNYKAVIWHSDNPSQVGYFSTHFDALEIYLGHQGNLLLSTSSKLAQNLSWLLMASPSFAQSRLGISDESEFGMLSDALQTRAFFVQAEGLEGLTDIDLNLTTPFNPLVNTFEGLSTITYFNPESGLDFLYKFGCKALTEPYPPTQEQFDLYTSNYVGYKFSQNGANFICLGFPLSYMEQSDVVTAMQELLADIMGGGK